MTCGVYQIKCQTTGKVYVGSSINIARRWREHRAELRRCVHASQHMQRAWNKHGADAFEFSVLLICSADMRVTYEQLMLDALQPEFNGAAAATGSFVGRRSEAVRAKLRDSARQRRSRYEWHGQKRCLREIAEMEGADFDLLMARVLRGMAVADALSKQRKPHRKTYEHDGRALTIKQWAAEFDMHPRRITYWLDAGMSIADCIARLNREVKSMSFSEFCRVSGVNLQTMKSRVFAKGLGVMDALTMPTVIRDQSWRKRAAPVT